MIKKNYQHNGSTVYKHLLLILISTCR